MLEIINLFVTILMFVAVVYICYLLRRRHSIDGDLPIAQIRRGMEKPVRRGPYAKPSDKKAPRVNDDTAAWVKENET